MSCHVQLVHLAEKARPLIGCLHGETKRDILYVAGKLLVRGLMHTVCDLNTNIYFL